MIVVMGAFETAEPSKGFGARFTDVLAWVVGPLMLGSLAYPLRAASEHVIPSRLLDVLPDLAWSFAIANVLTLIWPSSGPARTAWHVTGLTLAVGFEAGQGVGVVPGTFDALDLFGSGAAYGAALAINCGRKYGS